MNKAVPIISFANGIVAVCNFLFVPISPVRQSIALATFWVYGLCIGWFVRKRQVEKVLGRPYEEKGGRQDV